MNSYLEVKEKSYEIIEISEEGEEDDDKQETVEKNNKLSFFSEYRNTIFKIFSAIILKFLKI